jgi:hypothetical protein
MGHVAWVRVGACQCDNRPVRRREGGSLWPLALAALVERGPGRRGAGAREREVNSGTGALRRGLWLVACGLRPLAIGGGSRPPSPIYKAEVGGLGQQACSMRAACGTFEQA